MRILVSDGIAPEGVKIMEKAGHTVVLKKYSPEELIENIKNFDVIMVRSATKVPKEVIDAGNLKAIARGGVGLDNIDTVYASEKNIPVLNTPGASSISVAELTIAHIMGIGRFLHRSKAEMMAGNWPKKDFAKGMEVTGKTLGIIGFGNIGQEVAKRAKGLMMDVLVYDHKDNNYGLEVEMLSFDELIKKSDYISLHIPFNKSKGCVFSDAEFGKMKDGVVIINCARGGTIDEKALLTALNSGKVSNAAIDVYETEPAGQAQMALINHQNVSVTPHIGAATMEAQLRVSTEIASKVVDVLSEVLV